MMLRMRTSGRVWNRKATPPAPIHFIGLDIDLEEVSRFTDADGDWINVKVHFPLAPEPVEGAVRAADVIAATPKPFDLWSFAKYCTLSARLTNANKGGTDYGVSRDYLIALAFVLNDVQQRPLTKEQLEKFNPFQLTAEEWEAFRKIGQNATEYFPADRLDPLAQVDAAASTAFDNTQAISKALTKPGEGSGPYIPNTMDLFLANMIGAKAAIEALKKNQDTANSGGNALISDVVTASGGNFEALKSRYPAFLGGAAAPTIAKVLELIETRFDAAYILVAAALTELTPEDLPEVSSGGSAAPWFAAAKKEQDAGVKEPNPRILDYFKAIKFDTDTTKTPWCAAFVGFCMKNSGDPAIASSVPTSGPALAATWRKWGEGLPVASTDHPVGAVVVLSPTEPGDSSGHVGFYLRREGNKIVLLGGNQSDSVKESSYAMSRVVAIRWMNGSQPAAGGGGGGGGAPVVTGPLKLGPMTNADWAKFCDILGERESGNVYSKVNTFGYIGRWQFGAPALIDVGYVKRSHGRNEDLLSGNAWTGKNGVSNRDQWLAGKTAQDEAMLAYAQQRYRSMLRLGILTTTSSMGRVVGMLAASHLKGVGGARDLAKGQSSNDAFGTSTASYYALLATKFGGTASVQA